MFGRRRQDLRPVQFRNHYENVYILSYERHYVALARAHDASFPAQFDFDAIAVLTYRDKAHFDANWPFFEVPEICRIIAKDEANFSEWTKGVFWPWLLARMQRFGRAAWNRRGYWFRRRKRLRGLAVCCAGFASRSAVPDSRCCTGIYM